MIRKIQEKPAIQNNILNTLKQEYLYSPCVRTNNVKHNSSVARVILVGQRSAVWINNMGGKLLHSKALYHILIVSPKVVKIVSNSF